MRLFMLLLFFPIAILAQEKTVYGRIVEKNGQGVPFYQIGLYNSDTSFVKAILTDSLGNFNFMKLSSNTAYLLNINPNKKSYVFFSISSLEEEKRLPPFLVDKKLIQLNEVKIFGHKNFIDRDFDKLIINVNNMLITKGNRITDILPQLPGIKLDVFGGVSLNGRGGATILIDGKSSGNVSQAKVILSSMPAENIEKIEIISNPSVKYDAQGAGGIVNIILKKDKAISEFRTGIGSQLYPIEKNSFSGLDYKSENISLNFNALIKKVKTFYSFDLSGRKEYQQSEANRNIFSERIEINRNKIMRSNSKSYTYRVGASYDLSKSSFFDITLSGIGSFPYRLKETEIGLYNKSGIILIDSTLSYENNEKVNFISNTLSSGLQKTFDNKISKSLSIGFDVLNFRTKEYSEITTFKGSKTVADEFIERNRKLNVKSFAFKLDYSFKLRNVDIDAGGKYTLNYDYDFFNLKTSTKESNFIVNTENIFNFNESINAIYINLKKKMEKNRLQIGVRGENTKAKSNSNDYAIDRNFYNLFPNFSYQYSFNDEQQLQLSYGRRIRRLAFEEYNSFTYLKSPFLSTQGSPLLNPQFINVTELTYNTKNKSFLLSYSINQNVRDVFVSNEDVQQISRIINVKKVNNIFLLFTTPIRFSKTWTSNNSIDLYYQTSLLLDNTKKGSIGYDFSTNHILNFKNCRLETRFSYASPYQYSYIYVNRIIGWSMSFNKDISKKLNTNISFADILGTTRLKSSTNYINQIIESNSINNSRTMRISLRYKFNSGNKFILRNRPNIQNNEIRTR